MGQGEGQARPVGNRDPDQIGEEIEETREELGVTVVAVPDEADVKNQAKANASSGAFAVGLLVGWLVRWR